jgi:putative MATE family efflux protein
MRRDLTKGDISSQIRYISIPSSIGFLFYTLFNLTDTYFASTLSTNAIAALVLASTVYFMIISISRGMSSAVTSLVGNALGKKDILKVKNLVVHTYIFAFFMVVFLYIFYFLFIDYIFYFTSNNKEYLNNSIIFINIIVLAMPFYLTSSYSNAILTSHGDTKSFRNILIINFFINIILNIWFIYGGFGVPALGFAGIAYATITTECITSFYLLYKVYKLNIIDSFSFFEYNFNIIKEIFFQGLPATINMSLMSLGTFMLIYFLSTINSDVVAAYGIGVRLEQIALIPSVGISVAVAAMISQNNGAKNYKRLDEIMSKVYKYVFILYGFGFLFMFCSAYFLAPLFTSSSFVLEQAQIYIQINAILLLAYILIFVNVSFLQAIKKPKMIFYIGLVRQIILPFLLFNIIYYYKLDAFYYWIATFISVSLSTIYLHFLQKKYLKELYEKA